MSLTTAIGRDHGRSCRALVSRCPWLEYPHAELGLQEDSGNHAGCHPTEIALGAAMGRGADAAGAADLWDERPQRVTRPSHRPSDPAANSRGSAKSDPLRRPSVARAFPRSELGKVSGCFAQPIIESRRCQLQRPMLHSVRVCLSESLRHSSRLHDPDILRQCREEQTLVPVLVGRLR